MTNVLGTHTLLEAVRKNKNVTFLQVSTDEVYGSINSGASKEEDLLPVEKSWDTDYVDLVKPEVAIERYEAYMLANPKARENYNKVRPGFIATYESLLYDRRTVLVAYLKCSWGINS